MGWTNLDVGGLDLRAESGAGGFLFVDCKDERGSFLTERASSDVDALVRVYFGV